MMEEGNKEDSITLIDKFGRLKKKKEKKKEGKTERKLRHWLFSSLFNNITTESTIENFFLLPGYLLLSIKTSLHSQNT